MNPLLSCDFMPELRDLREPPGRALPPADGVGFASTLAKVRGEESSPASEDHESSSRPPAEGAEVQPAEEEPQDASMTGALEPVAATDQAPATRDSANVAPLAVGEGLSTKIAAEAIPEHQAESAAQPAKTPLAARPPIPAMAPATRGPLELGLAEIEVPLGGSDAVTGEAENETDPAAPAMPRVKLAEVAAKSASAELARAAGESAKEAKHSPRALARPVAAMPSPAAAQEAANAEQAATRPKTPVQGEVPEQAAAQPLAASSAPRTRPAGGLDGEAAASAPWARARGGGQEQAERQASEDPRVQVQDDAPRGRETGAMRSGKGVVSMAREPEFELVSLGAKPVLADKGWDGTATAAAKAAEQQQVLLDAELEEIQLPRLPQQTLRILSQLHRDGRSSYRASFRLDPPELGRVEVDLRLDGDRVWARFTVESPEAREQLQSSLGRLRESLNIQGLEESRVEVNLGFNASGDTGAGAREEDSFASGARAGEEAEQEAAAATNASRHEGHIDLRV